MIHLGIDPGKSGAIAASYDVGPPEFRRWTTLGDAREWLTQLTPFVTPMHALIESVHAMPKQGVASTFKFGTNFGMWQGLLCGLGIPCSFVTPQTWQRAMQCLSRGDKNVTKARAQELFPTIKITHANADALLIAEHGRRVARQEVKT